MAGEHLILRNGLHSLLQQPISIVEVADPGHGAVRLARRLVSLDIDTVETHRQQLMLKLDVSSIAELTKCAIRKRLTSPEQ